jgi:hypothetical protein
LIKYTDRFILKTRKTLYFSDRKRYFLIYFSYKVINQIK